MQLENELKFALTRYTSLQSGLRSKLGPPASLRQGYLNNETRIRHRDARGQVSYELGFKRRTENGHNHDVAGRITAADFEHLWGIATPRLQKSRFTFQDDVVTWDIDFFAEPDSGLVYFAMAEVEMPADMLAPQRIPDDLVSHIGYAVPRTDARFSSMAVANIPAAKALALEFGLLA